MWGDSIILGKILTTSKIFILIIGITTRNSVPILIEMTSTLSKEIWKLVLVKISQSQKKEFTNNLLGCSWFDSKQAPTPPMLIGLCFWVHGESIDGVNWMKTFQVWWISAKGLHSTHGFVRMFSSKYNQIHYNFRWKRKRESSGMFSRWWMAAICWKKLPAKKSKGVEETGWIRVKGNLAGSSPSSPPFFLSSLVSHPRISPFLIRLTSPSFLSFIFNLYRPTFLPFNLGHTRGIPDFAPKNYKFTILHSTSFANNSKSHSVCAHAFVATSTMRICQENESYVTRHDSQQRSMHLPRRAFS